MSILFPDQKAKKAKRTVTMSDALLAINSIHMLLVFGLLLAAASAIFLALPRDDVSDLGVLRITLELFLLALTVLGAVVLYRPYQNMSRSVMLVANVVLIAAVIGIKHQLGIESAHPRLSLTLGLLGLSVLFLVEARLYQFHPLGGLAAMCFLATPSLIFASELRLTGHIIAAAVLLIIMMDEQLYQKLRFFVPVDTVVVLIYMMVPSVLIIEIARDIFYELYHGAIPPLSMLSTWFAAGLFYLIDARASESEKSVSPGVVLLGIGTLAVEFFYNPFYGGAAWLAGGIFILIGAVDIYLQDCERDVLARYGHTFTKAGGILIPIGLLYSAVMHPFGAITFSGLTVMEVISHSIVLGLNHPPALLLIVGSIFLFVVGTWLTRRSFELNGALITFSLLYLYGMNQLVDQVQSPDLTNYYGWLLFPLAAGMIATGLYGNWFHARQGSILPYLGLGGWWAVVSTVLALVELQNGQGAVLFALYAAIAGYMAYQTGLRMLVAASSAFATLALSYFLLPVGAQPGQIALILLVIAFMFYLLSLLCFMAESMRQLGHTLHLIGITMLSLAAFFALAWVKVSPEVFTLSIALGGLVIAIEYFRQQEFTVGFAALSAALAALWITIYFLPGSFDKLQFYTMSIGTYAVATHVLLRHKKYQDSASAASLGAMAVVLGATFYQLFLMPDGNRPAYFGVLVIQVSLLFFVGLFLRSRLFVTIPLVAFVIALITQLLFSLWEVGSGGLLSIILIMTVIGVPAIMAGITLAVARDSLLRAGRLFQDQLEEWNL